MTGYQWLGNVYVASPDATCVQLGPEVADQWFPERGAWHTGHRAANICRRCPDRVPCLTFALDNGIRHGIWGGFSFDSPIDRKNARRHLKGDQR